MGFVEAFYSESSIPVVKGWILMGKDLNWNALPSIVELIGISDVELFIMQIMTIKTWVSRGQ